MSHLPITSNSAQPAARGAPGGIAPLRSDPSTVSGNAANGAQTGGGAADAQAAGVQATGPFAALLARQIVETGRLDGLKTSLFAPGAAQAAIAVDSGAADSDADRTARDVLDQAAVAANTPVDPANTLAAMLLQLPQESRAPVTGDAAGGAVSPTAGNGNAAGIDIAMFKAASRNDPPAIKPGTDTVKPDTANTAPGKTDAPPIVPDRPIITGALGRDASGRVELPAGPPQPNPNIIQAAASPAISAAMPAILAGSKPADNLQTVAAPLGSSGWAGEFSQKISWMCTQQNQVAELHLNPPDLGPLHVVLKISDNQATALFTSPHGAVREAVENALPKLREMLADNGITLGNTTVSDQSPRDRSTERSMNQGFGATAQQEASGSTAPPPATTQAAPLRRHNGMVDTFA
ncbi:MAG: hypothetical protein EPN21_15815 [Methylococcaceae bacterium]|nr:MAG: hypothetical protein EPN21_15815 [Methylococcaceae bacterium]